MNLFKKPLKLKKKLIILYLLTIFIPLMIIEELFLGISGNLIIKQTTASSVEASKQITQNISELLRRNVYACDRFSFDEVLKDYLDTSRVYESETDSINAYTQYLRPITNYDFTLRYDATTLKIYYLNSTLLPGFNFYIYADENIRNSPVFHSAVQSGTYMTWGISDNNNIYLSRTIRGANGTLFGVTSIEIPEKSIYSLIRETNQNDKTIIIADEKGKVISSNNRSLIGGSINSKTYFSNMVNKDEGILDYQGEGKKKVIFSRIGHEVNLPRWYIVCEVPLDNLIKEERKIRTMILVISLLCLAISCIAFLYFLDRITSRIKTLVLKMQKVKEGTFTTIEEDGKNDEIGIITTNFNLMVKGLEQLINDNYIANLQLKDIYLKKREAELYALQSQINPHFLFNTLESIRMKLINVENRESSEMILSLSKILRKSLNWQGEMITLAEELDFVKNYLDIQKHRFIDRLSYETCVPDSLLKGKIPKLVIQPIVENAIKHGIESKRRSGLVRITAFTEGKDMFICIEDNGSGIEPKKLSKIRAELDSVEEVKKEGSLGLKNVHDRIVLHYGNQYGIRIESTSNEGTTVTIKLPLQQ